MCVFGGGVHSSHDGMGGSRVGNADYKEKWVGWCLECVLRVGET